jgi:uncharacterized membrane protein YbhN (UPF0104 family)
VRSTATVTPVPPVSRRSRIPWAWIRAVGGAGVLAVLAWQVGTGPFLAGLRMIDGAALATAVGIGVLTTVCCAWRWRMIAAGLGIRLPLHRAVAAYYRAQFLNTTLPGGVAGDVHRAVRHGHDIGDLRLGVRAVTAPLTQLAPLTLLALLAMMLPVNVAGWGSREGVAAWAFGAAGLTAAQGVATAVAYGVLAFAACLPGAAVLALRLMRTLRQAGGRRG